MSWANVFSARKFLSSIIAAALLALAALLVYGRTLGGYFIADDFGYVSLFASLPLRRWPELFVREWSLGIWGFQLHELRPIPALSFMLDAAIWKGEAFGYRLTNLLLHVTCSYMVFAIGSRLLGLRTPVAFAAALFFAVHPSHAVPVVWITGRVDMLPPLFCMAGLLAFDHFRRRGSLVALSASYLCYFAAAFSKEYGLVLPFLIAAYDFSRADTSASPLSKENWRQRVTPYVGYFVVAAIYYLCRRIAFDGGLAAPRGLPPWWHVAGQQTDYWRYLLGVEESTAGGLFAWRPGAHVAVLSVVALVGLGAMLILALVVPLIRRSAPGLRSRLLFCGPIWFLTSTLPFTITYTSARHLYLASAGFCLFLAALLGTADSKQLRKWAVAVSTLLVLAWSFETYQHSLHWARTGAISKQIISELRRLEETPRHTVLVLDIPVDATGGAYVFAWSSPFLVDRPFLKKSLRTRLIILENPRVYYTPVRWNQKREIARVAQSTGQVTAYSLVTS